MKPEEDKLRLDFLFVSKYTMPRTPRPATYYELHRGFCRGKIPFFRMHRPQRLSSSGHRMAHWWTSHSRHQYHDCQTLAIRRREPRYHSTRPRYEWERSHLRRPDSVSTNNGDAQFRRFECHVWVQFKWQFPLVINVVTRYISFSSSFGDFVVTAFTEYLLQKLLNCPTSIFEMVTVGL